MSGIFIPSNTNYKSELGLGWDIQGSLVLSCTTSSNLSAIQSAIFLYILLSALEDGLTGGNALLSELRKSGLPRLLTPGEGLLAFQDGLRDRCRSAVKIRIKARCQYFSVSIMHRDKIWCKWSGGVM